MTAFVSAGATSGLSLANSVFGSGVDTLNSTFYASQTFTAMEQAIHAGQKDVRDEMQKKMYPEPSKSDNSQSAKPPMYTMDQALDDWHRLNHACSIQEGLMHLQATASNSATTTTIQSTTTTTSPDENH